MREAWRGEACRLASMIIITAKHSQRVTKRNVAVNTGSEDAATCTFGLSPLPASRCDVMDCPRVQHRTHCSSYTSRGRTFLGFARGSGRAWSCERLTLPRQVDRRVRDSRHGGAWAGSRARLQDLHGCPNKAYVQLREHLCEGANSVTTRVVTVRVVDVLVSLVDNLRLRATAGRIVTN